MSLKKVLLVVLISSGIAIYYYSTQTNVSSGLKEHPHKNTTEVAVDTPDTMPEEPSVIAAKKQGLYNESYIDKNNTFKGIDDSWCSASNDLKIEDYSFVEESTKNWHMRIGRAYIGFDGDIYQDDTFYSDNYVLAPYQEMSIVELERSANTGDKWAMVTYIQKSTFREHKQALHFANELLIAGAIHHALEYLVKSELITAKSNFRKNDFNSASYNIVNAIAYSLLGLEDYSEGGLQTYLGITTRDEIIKDIIQPSKFFKENSTHIKNKFNSLTQELEAEREKRSIFLELAPDSVKKHFNTYLAATTLNSDNGLKLFNELAISDTLLKVDRKCIDRLKYSMNPSK